VRPDALLYEHAHYWHHDYSIAAAYREPSGKGEGDSGIFIKCYNVDVSLNTVSGQLELLDDRTVVMPLTVEQYHQMIAGGIVAEGEPYELLGGWIVRKDRSAAGEDPMSVGAGHVWTIKKLEKLGSQIESMGCHIRLQAPISNPPLDEPEPDAAIVTGTEDDYRDYHPGAAEVRCVIEVADSSLRRDRTTKQRIYADAGIPQYVILNLADRVAEIFTEPLVGNGRYRQDRTVAAEGTLILRVSDDQSLSVSLNSLLP
jgi:Uma2 family endonuclease